MFSKNTLKIIFFFFTVVLIMGCKTTDRKFFIIEVKNNNLNIFLDGASDPKEIRFEGSELSHSYIQENRLFKVTGNGTIHYKKNVISIKQNEVRVNDEKVSAGETAPMNYVLSENGEIKEGFIRTFK